MPQVMVGVAEAVPGAAQTVAISGRLQDLDGLLADGDGLREVTEHGAHDAGVVECGTPPRLVADVPIQADGVREVDQSGGVVSLLAGNCSENDVGLCLA